MYLEFYGFKEAPFNLTPDSKFLFLSHRHQEALAALVFGVQERKGGGITQHKFELPLTLNGILLWRVQKLSFGMTFLLVATTYLVTNIT